MARHATTNERPSSRVQTVENAAAARIGHVRLYAYSLQPVPTAQPRALITLWCHVVHKYASFLTWYTWIFCKQVNSERDDKDC